MSGMNEMQEVDNLCAKKALLMTRLAIGRMTKPEFDKAHVDISAIDARMKELRGNIEAGVRYLTI